MSQDWMHGPVYHIIPTALFESWQVQLEYKKLFSLSDFASEMKKNHPDG